MTFDKLFVDKKSDKLHLSKEDLRQAVKEAVIFLGPALLVLIASTMQAIPADWKYGAVVLFLLNRVTDLIRRFLADNTKKK